jgi:hypothetical protein
MGPNASLRDLRHELHVTLFKKHAVPTLQETHSVSVTKTNRLMLFGTILKIMNFTMGMNKKFLNALCGEKCAVTEDGACSDHSASGAQKD